MFGYLLNLIGIRSFMVVVCLGLLAGCGGSGESVDSTAAAAAPPTAAPAAPTDLTATPGNAQASLTWSASSGAASYAVKRSTTSGGPYTQLATAKSPSYTDTTVSNGTTYHYVVAAANSAGESSDSAQASVTPSSTITTPPVPAGLAATAGSAQVNLTWSASSGASGYHVKRATTSGGPYTQVAAPASNSYTDTSLTNGTTYYYVVSAVGSAGESANSAQVMAMPVCVHDDSHHTRRSRSNGRQCASEPRLVCEQRRDQLPCEARHDQRRTLRTGRGARLELLYRHLGNQRHDVLLRCLGPQHYRRERELGTGQRASRNADLESSADHFRNLDQRDARRCGSHRYPLLRQLRSRDRSG